MPGTLITGGAGFVGLNVAEALLGRGAAVVLYDRRAPPVEAGAELAKLPGRLTIVEGDVLDGTALADALRRHAVDRLVHAAAVTAGPDRERRDAATIVRVNVAGTVEALEAALRARVGRVVHVSSASVFGASAFSREALEEEALTTPETLYAVTKYAGERIALRYQAFHGLDVVVARLAAVFGRWEHETGVRDTLSAPLLVTRLAEAGMEARLPRPGLRDWVYAVDVAAAIVTLLDHPAPVHRLYHVGPGVRWSIEAWCARLADRFPAFRYGLAHEPGAATVDFHGDRDRAPLSIARLTGETAFRPRFGLAEAFADYLDWRTRHRV